jgi:hypothetical protein
VAGGVVNAELEALRKAAYAADDAYQEALELGVLSP